MQKEYIQSILQVHQINNIAYVHVERGTPQREEGDFYSSSFAAIVDGSRERSRVHGFARLSFRRRRHGRESSRQGRESFHALVSTEACCVNSPTRGRCQDLLPSVWLLCCATPRCRSPGSNYNQMTDSATLIRGTMTRKAPAITYCRCRSALQF